jgi:hypothetical protein
MFSMSSLVFFQRKHKMKQTKAPRIENNATKEEEEKNN